MVWFLKHILFFKNKTQKMTFADDLADWKQAEQEFARYLCTCPKFISIEVSQWKFKDYDIKLTTKDKVVTYEIKSDRKAQDTGNYCIEFSYDNKASWIYSSKADYIVYHLMWQWWMAPRGDLILKLDSVEKKRINWWDWFKSWLWLLKVDTLPQLFTQLDLSYDYNWNEKE